MGVSNCMRGLDGIVINGKTVKVYAFPNQQYIRQTYYSELALCQEESTETDLVGNPNNSSAQTHHTHSKPLLPTPSLPIPEMHHLLLAASSNNSTAQMHHTQPNQSLLPTPNLSNTGILPNPPLPYPLLKIPGQGFSSLPNLNNYY